MPSRFWEELFEMLMDDQQVIFGQGHKTTLTTEMYKI